MRERQRRSGTQKRRPCGHGGRDESYVVTSQGMSTAAGSCQTRAQACHTDSSPVVVILDF